MRLKRKDGKILTVLASAIAVSDDQGNILEYRGINHDITDRKHAEEELRKRDILISTVLETSPAAIYALDKEGFVLTWNKGAELMFGCSKETVIGKFYPFVPEDKREEFDSSMEKILRGEQFIGVESKRLRMDGSVIDVSVTSAPLFGSDGEVTGAISVVTDMTQQKKMESEQFILEDQLRQAQKMEAVGQLAGGVAHDFNNILSAIVGYSHLSMMNMEKNDPNLHNLQEIIASVERATLLTQGLLAFSRKQMINLAVYSLNEIVEKLDKFLLRLLREDIELKTILTGEMLSVMADRGQLELILLNLVTNARDAMPEGGRIIIETDCVKIDQSFINAHGFGQIGDYALITLTDTGIGIPDDIKDKIYDPFFTTKEEGKGTGLGLSTVYGIVKKHEGYINAYSQVGIGTTFKIYLPAMHMPPDAEMKTDELIGSAGGTETILIAEDNDAVRRMTAETLQSYGYRVIEASDGLDAIAKFKENRDIINLVVLDGIMPKMNGREAWQVINAINPKMKAVFVSGYAEDIFTKDGMPDMDMPFISKPAPPSVLLAKIRDILDR
jgi:PAS domain S-box-containing protein